MVARGSDRIIDVVEELVAELPARLRGGQARLSEHTVGALRTIAEQLNLVTRDDLDELELRVAQLEHRLHLLEQKNDAL